EQAGHDIEAAAEVEGGEVALVDRQAPATGDLHHLRVDVHALAAGVVRQLFQVLARATCDVEQRATLAPDQGIQPLGLARIVFPGVDEVVEVCGVCEQRPDQGPGRVAR